MLTVTLSTANKGTVTPVLSDAMLGFLSAGHRELSDTELEALIRAAHGDTRETEAAALELQRELADLRGRYGAFWLNLAEK